MSHPILRDTTEKMAKSVVAFVQELSHIRTGRANPAMLDVIEVDAYGQTMKLNQLGNITTPDSQLIVIDLWDKGMMSAVEKAIRESPLGMNPQNDGKVIRVPVPSLTEERRRELVKVAKKHVEEAHIALRAVRRHAIDEIKRLQKDGEIPEDDARRLSDEVQKATDKHVAEVDELFKHKEADIMEV
jgi:ribosome recycling factor